jgi:AraC-like DNA-binding protein
MGLMKPDNPVAPPDRLQRAHLVEASDTSHQMHRYPAPDDLADLVQWYWVPLWSVPAGHESVQRVLQYPCALIVVTEEYARFYGVVTGLSSTTLVGDGWAVGALLQPAAGSLLAGDMSELTDTHVELAELFGPDGAELAAAVRDEMRPPAGPGSVAAHHAATAHVDGFLRRALPVDDEGRELNELVRFVEEHPEVTRVAQLAEHAGRSERSLQRLVRRRLGLSPKWLIQRRRLQEASLRLRRLGPGESLADVAAELGYADQAHFARDLRTVTGSSPSELARRLGQVE